MYNPYSCWKKGIYYTNPNILGKNIDIAGKYVTSNKATNIIAKYGNMYLITLSIVTPPTRHPVKRIVPTGGVIVPIDKLKQRRIPKCIGLMPNAVHIGSKIGVKIRIARIMIFIFSFYILKREYKQHLIKFRILSLPVLQIQSL